MKKTVIIDSFDGLPYMNISKTVQTFYNKTPFPDYDLDRFNTKEDLLKNIK